MIWTILYRPYNIGPYENPIRTRSQAGPQIVSNETIIDKVKVIELPFQIEEKRGKTIEICIAGNCQIFRFRFRFWTPFRL